MFRFTKLTSRNHWYQSNYRTSLLVLPTLRHHWTLLLQQQEAAEVQVRELPLASLHRLLAHRNCALVPVASRPLEKQQPALCQTDCFCDSLIENLSEHLLKGDSGLLQSN